MSSDRMHDLVSSRINEGMIYKYIDIQAGIGVRCKTLFYEDATNNQGRAVVMRLQGLPPLDTRSKRSKKNSPKWRTRQPGRMKKMSGDVR